MKFRHVKCKQVIVTWVGPRKQWPFCKKCRVALDVLDKSEIEQVSEEDAADEDAQKAD